MEIPSTFRSTYDTCLTDQAAFDGYDVAPEEYLELLRSPAVDLRSRRQMNVGGFVLAHRAACEDIANGVVSNVLPRTFDVRMDSVSDLQLVNLQREHAYTWTEFFDEYLRGVFGQLGKDDPLWRDATNLSPCEIIKSKRAKFEAVKPRDRIAQARKRAAYLAIASFAHDDEPITP